MTDTIRWDKVIREEPGSNWNTRSELVAHLIRPDDVVCDLGAGAQPLRRFLPSSVGYIPVDCVKVYPDTHVADFNADFTLPDEPFNVITCLGLVAHLDDLSHFFGTLIRDHAGKFIIFDVDARKRAAEAGQPRRFRTYDEMVQYFSGHVRDMSLFAQIRNRYFFCGLLGSSDSTTIVQRRPVDEIISKNMSSLKYLRYRVVDNR